MSPLDGGRIYFQRPPILHPDGLSALVASAPMMHGAAMWESMISLLAGHFVVVTDQNHFDAEHFLDLIEREDVNIDSMVGDAMAMPLETYPVRWKPDRLMVVGKGGALLSVQFKW